MKRLTEIGISTNTDKATYHKFTEIYDDVFSKYTRPRILEIGVYNFASIKMYQKYFESPYIVGMDVDDKSMYIDGSWKFVRGDQSNISDLKKCVYGENLFDIIIDDGGHTMRQQQISMGFLIDYIKSGGYYIIEDLHTSFRPSYIESDCKFTTYDMLNMIMLGEVGFSNYIDDISQRNIITKIENIKIWAKNESDLTDSVTAIIKIKK